MNVPEALKKAMSRLLIMPFCLLLECIIQHPVYKGDNHHEDPMRLLILSSSRITIHTSLYPASAVLLSAYSL